MPKRLCLLKGRYAIWGHAIVGEIGEEQGKAAFGISRSFHAQVGFLGQLSHQPSLDLRESLDSTVVAKDEAPSFEGVAIAHMNAHSWRGCAAMRHDAARAGGVANFNEIRIGPGRLRVFENRWLCWKTAVRRRVPSHTKTVGIHLVIVAFGKARVKRCIDRLIDERVAWLQNQVAQVHFFGRDKGNPAAHDGRGCCLERLMDQSQERIVKALGDCRFDRSYLPRDLDCFD